MEDPTDVYKTIAKVSGQIVYKDKKSKFYGYAFPIANEEDVKPLIEKIKIRHPNANHVCYAWQLGLENARYRANDDGEPNNSAGMPIYGQILSFEVTNVLIAVARIFGDTKLGVGGLINAYRTTAQSTLETCSIIEKTLQHNLTLSFQYASMDAVMRKIKQRQLTIISQKLQMDCEIVVSVRKKDAEMVRRLFKGLPDVTVK